MGADYTRVTFDPRRDHAGVLMQQGRVQVDADWNELVALMHRRLRAETVDIVDPAVAVDTAARLQTVLRVRLLQDVGNITCSTKDEDVPGWLDLVRPSAGRLTTAAVGVPSADDPCTIAADGGYRGPENRLYRVEIHEPGPLGTATFKWSRDNASVATAVTSVDGT